MRPHSALSCEDEESVRQALGHDPSRVLVVGRDGSSAALRWSQAGASVARLDSLTMPDAAERPWDVVYVAGALERERWDRWFLQRIHRAMAPRGILVVATLNLLDIGSLDGLRYLATGAVREAARRLRPRSAIPAADRSAFRGRRYRLVRLAAMVEDLGFEIVSACVREPGAPGAVVRALGGVGRQIGRRIVVVARRLPSLWGADRPFPPREVSLDGFRLEHARAIEARDAWRANARPAPHRPVDLEDWSRRGVLVFAPHPDDEVIGCGGTLLDLAGRGAAVTIVQVTDGSDSAAFVDEPETVRTRVRLDEARAVAKGLGARELVCLKADNRALQATPELQAQFAELIGRGGPGLVFAPSFTDIHPDHQTVLRLVAEAMSGLSGPLPDVALYEVWSLVAPTHIHEVAARMPEIEALLLRYETALKIDDYVHLVARRLLFNAWEHLGRAGYAECFQVLPGSRFLELASAHFQRAFASH